MSKLHRLPTAFLLIAAATALPTLAQDGRGTVAEPTIPTVCTVLSATTSISSGEPASETLTNTSPDTAAIQSALSACASGQAVELALSGSNNAFLSGPLFIPNGRTLLIDGGVTLFASRNPADYQIGTVSASQEACGTVGTLGNGCNPFLVIGQASLAGKSTSTNSNLMGYGIINGRGQDKLIVSGALASYSWWDQAANARSVTNGSQNNPILVSLYKANSSSIYKVTLLNSPMFHVKNNQSTGWTVWGAKVITPWTARNSDGIDPSNTTNITITNSVIGDGDDEIAVGASSSPAFTGATLSNLQLVSGHGLSVGSYTSGGVSNVLASNINFYGQAADGNQGGLHIKSASDRGGLVQNFTYQNVCIQNVYRPIQLDPAYNTNSGTSYPSYKNITYANIHGLTGTSSVYLEFAGLNSSYLSTVTLDNVVFDKITGFSPASTYTTFTFSNAISGTATPQVYPASLTTFSGTGVTYTNTATVSNANAYSCTNAYPALVGELYASTSTLANNPKTATLTIPGSVTLKAIVEPVQTQIVYSDPTAHTTNTAVPAPTASIQFLEGATVVGTGTLSANGTLATAVITNPTAGTHTYTAAYVGDSTFPAQTFGSFTLTVTAGPAAKLGFTAPPASAQAYGGSQSNVVVAVQDAAGDTVSSAASVTLMVSGANGYSATYNASAVAGVATFNLGSITPPVGAVTYTATATGLTAASAGQTVTAAMLTVSAQAASRQFGAQNPTLSYTITGFVNGDTSAVISGSPRLTTTATANSPAGNYPISVAQGSLTAANYVFALNGNFLTVTGGAAQMILFAPLPNFPSGAAYQLTARATSGQAVTYTVSGPATVSGSTLTITAPGAITVTASSVATASYAAAPASSQSFTAQ